MIPWRYIFNRKQYFAQVSVQGQSFAWEAWRQARRAVVFVIGSTVILFGLVFLVTPGPGWAGIFLGIAILATEFVWARRLLKRMKKEAMSAGTSFAHDWRKSPRLAAWRTWVRTRASGRRIYRDLRKPHHDEAAPSSEQGEEG
jgi:uncharacterized protein (TIGR02611 family)